MRIDFISWLSATAFIACFLHRVFGRGRIVQFPLEL
jgi:hypothetical protein